MQPIKPIVDQPVALISSLAPAYVKETLAVKGFVVLEIPENEFVYKAVCTHPDLFLHLCHGKRARLFIAQELPCILGAGMQRLIQRADFLNMDVCMVEQPLDKIYPRNVLLNGVRVGRFLLGNSNTLSASIIKAHEQEGRKLIHVKQGYTKCSVAVVSNRAMITEDEGIAKAALAQGLDVLMLKKGSIHLKEFDYGFIGGCAGLLSEHELIFAGDIERHPQVAEILAFCKKHNVTVVKGEGPLMDVGSILII